MNDLIEPIVRFDFPEPKLLAELVQLYFDEYNDFQWPILHRPTVLHSLQNGTHLRDETFGMIILLCCALGSRFSQDPRVVLPNSENWHTAGWKWFRQVQARRRLILMVPPRVYDLQMACVSGKAHF